MYSKATYVKPYIRKFIRVLGINNVGTLNKPKMNVIYAILANNGIKPIDKNKYGVPLFQYRDLDGLNDTSIIAGFHKWKDDMLRKDIEMSMRDNKPKNEPKHKQPDTQLSLFSEMKFNDSNDDKLYSDLFGKKIFLTEKQVEYINKNQSMKKTIYLTEKQVQLIKEQLDKEKYIENEYHEKWEKQSTDSDIFKKFESILNAVKKHSKNPSRLGLMDVAYVDDKYAPHYIAIIDGGLNGSGEWKDYLDDIKQIIVNLPHSYIVDLDVDVCDDVWTLKVGINKDKLNEGAWGVKPEQSDSYLDLSHELGEPIIKILLEKLSKVVNNPKDNDGNIYYWLGLMLDMLKVKAFDESWLYSHRLDNSKDSNVRQAKSKYKTNIDLFAIANKGFDYLLTDNAEENRQGWKNFSEYQKYLKKMYKEFKKLEDYYNMDKDDPAGADKLVKESNNYVNTNKVLLITKYLDDNFVRASMPIIGADGYPTDVKIVGMKGTDGEVIRNMTAKQLFYLLQDKFKGIYGDKKKRDAFIKQTMIDWYNRKVSKDGLLSKNTY